jgi:hypothetical protein
LLEAAGTAGVLVIDAVAALIEGMGGGICTEPVALVWAVAVRQTSSIAVPTKNLIIQLSTSHAIEPCIANNLFIDGRV